MRPRYARLIAASVLAAGVSAAWAADAGAPIRFEITRYEVSGNTLLSAAEISAAVTPFTGRERSFGDVQGALEALEAAYRAKGFNVVSVRLPEQELNRGVVQFNVVQTKIGRINVSGNRHFDQANILRSMPTLVAGRTPNLNDMSANLRLANENPARKTNLKLQNASADDEVNANLAVTDDRPWKVMLNLDNTGSETTGKTHAGVVFQHANLFGRDHVASFQYTTTVEEPSKVAVYGLGYHVPLYALGDSLDLFASYSNIDTGQVTAGLFNLNVSGKGAVYGARYNHTLTRRGELDTRLVFGVDVKAFRNTVLFAGENFGNDITVRPLSLAYTASTPTAKGDANAALTLVHNIPGGSRGSDADFERTRSFAKPGYTILRFGAALSHTLAGDWQARLLLNGQLTGDALVPGEQFGAGGSTTVRGLDERAVSTDSGMAVNLEMYTPGLCPAQADWQCRALAFYDAATGTRNHALAGEIDSTSVASVGLGLRFAMGSKLNAQVDYGHVVQAGETTGSRNKVHVRLGFAY